MGFFVDELCTSVLVTHVLYKAALAIAILRWAFSWGIRIRNRTRFASDPSPSQPHDIHRCASTQAIRDSLVSTSFGDFAARFPNCPWDTCAVCLGRFGSGDEVRELRNCCHVFHGECLDRWLDHGRQNQTCPLCRAPFVTEAQARGVGCAAEEPSWAVERLLYLFGDDLLL